MLGLRDELILGEDAVGQRLVIFLESRGREQPELAGNLLDLRFLLGREFLEPLLARVRAHLLERQRQSVLYPN